MIASLVAMTIAVFCALVPLGTALGRAPGSAFDPSTAVVSLQPRTDVADSNDEELANEPEVGATATSNMPMKLDWRFPSQVTGPHDTQDAAMAYPPHRSMSLSAEIAVRHQARAPPIS